MNDIKPKPYRHVDRIAELEAQLSALTAERDQMRVALEALSYIHDGNPSFVMADMPPLDYARHMLSEVRKTARAALAPEQQ